ncbi:YciI family protein [Nonomuraea sp. NPDC049480]|uniref:YciI family protein n=1 Tax=Nonomuraea sp. NPDC049480 TaxID=3364353 RepID=UPI0037A25579
MAQYAILLYAKAPADPDDLTPEESEAHHQHGQDVAKLGGTMLTAFALQPSTTATTVRGDAITDGPFLDAKEVVAGVYVIEAPDLDVALEIARRNPITQLGGGVEVRPVASGFFEG